MLCESLFKELYAIHEPILPLGRLLQWTDMMRKLGIPPTDLDRADTLIFGGFFYNTSTPVPGSGDIRRHLEWGRTDGVSQFLIPTVRNSVNSDALLSEGFVSFPWLVEAAYDLREGVHADLPAPSWARSGTSGSSGFGRPQVGRSS